MTEPTGLQCLHGWCKRAARPGALDDCSLVVPTYQRAGEMLALLNTLVGLPDPPGEVVVVDGSPGREVETAVTEWARLQALPFDMIYVRSPAGLTRQRNVGIDASTRDFVFYLDDDCLPQPGYFRAIRQVFVEDASGEVGAVCGSIINEMDQPLSWRWRIRFALRLVPRGEPGKYYPTATSVPHSIQKPFTGVRSVDVLPGGAVAYRRAVFARHRFSHFFDGYSQGEDLEMSRRIARDWKLLACGDAHVVHNHAQHGRPAGFARGRMTIRNRYFIWKRHNHPIRFVDRVRFWGDQIYSIVYHIAFFLRHPLQSANILYALGMAAGAAECVLSPPRYEEPPAAREYEFILKPLVVDRSVQGS